MLKSTMSRRGFLQLSLGVALAQLVAACGPGATPAPEPTTETKVEATEVPAPSATPAPQPVTLRISTFIDPAQDCARCQSLKQIRDNFKQANPNVDFSFEISPWDQVSNKFMTAFVAGNEPDISWCEIQFTPEVMKQGSAQDLGQWIFSEWTEESRRDFPEALWQVGLDGQKKFFLTTYHMTDGILYRKDLFDEAGIDVASLKTWDLMVQALQKLTVDKNGKHPTDADFDAANVTRWGFGEARGREQGGINLYATMLPEGVEPIDRATCKANWVNDAGVKAMTLWADFITKYKVQSKEDLTKGEEEQEGDFESGLVAVNRVGSEDYKDVASKVTFDPKNIGVMPFPTFSGQGTGPCNTWGWAVLMSSNSKQKDTAWKFLDYYVSPESDLLNVKVGGQLPTRASTTKDPYFSTPEAEYLTLYINAMNASSYMSAWNCGDAWSNEVLIAFHDIVLNNVPVQDALQAAADRYNATLES